MRFATIVAIVLVTVPKYVEAQGLCGPQDYNSEVPPNFECPGPEEGAMSVDLNPPPSIPLGAGTKIVDAQGRSLVLGWDGAAVHRDRLIEMGLKLYAVRRLRWADRLRLSKERDINAEHREEMCDIRVKALNTEIESYQARLQSEQLRSTQAEAWYRSPWFGIVVGFFSASVLVALAAWALNGI